MISVEGVTKRFGALVAVRDLSFGIDRGEVVGFLGPNGAGKTTTMRMLTGVLQPDEGRVLYDGRSIGDDLTGAKRRLGYLPEANPLYEDMLVCEFLEHTARLRGLHGGAARSAIQDAVAETGLDEVFFRPIAEASKGFRQRIGLAAAILHHPEILVLDEPTEGLDPNQRVEIRKLIGELGRDRTVLLSTHVMQEVEATCSRLVIISAGRKVADGSVAELLAGRQGAARYTIEVEGTDAAAALAELPGVQHHAADAVDGRTRVQLTASGEELRPRIFRLAAERGWVLWELHRERATLEQVFHELTVSAEGGGPVPSNGGAAVVAAAAPSGREEVDA